MVPNTLLLLLDFTVLTERPLFILYRLAQVKPHPWKHLNSSPTQLHHLPLSHCQTLGEFGGSLHERSHLPQFVQWRKMIKTFPGSPKVHGYRPFCGVSKTSPESSVWGSGCFLAYRAMQLPLPLTASKAGLVQLSDPTPKWRDSTETCWKKIFGFNIKSLAQGWRL